MSDAELTYEEFEIDREDRSKNDDNEAALEVEERKFTKLVISLYRNSPILWHTEHKFYSLKEKRSHAVERILEVLRKYKPDYDARRFKTKINILRTNFNKTRKSMSSKKASGQDHEPMLWYYKDLLFLKDEDQRQLAIAEADSQNEALFVPSSMPVLEVGAVRPLYMIKTHTLKKRTLASNEHTIIPRKVYLRKDPLSLASSLEKPDKITEVKSERRSSSSDRDSMAERVTEYDAVGINVARKLQKMDPEQAIYAESIINNVIRDGLLHRLTDETDICTKGCGGAQPLSYKSEAEEI